MTMLQVLQFHTLCMVCGAALDFVVGDPAWLPHPVRGIGRLIKGLEKLLYREADTPGVKRAKGSILTVTVAALSAGICFLLLMLAMRIHRTLFMVIAVLISSQMIAAKGLIAAAGDVGKPLMRGDIEEARAAVSMIVGRDTDALDKEGITKAAIETVAENTSDGIIAPLFFIMLGGPAGGMLYKAVNTMDSMIGYRNERYEDFGKAAARTDDVFNFIPARISALLMIAAAFLTGLDWRNAWRIFLRDRNASKSPNAGQTESVCAGALNVGLLGNAVYFGKVVEKPTIGDAERRVVPEDIGQSCRLTAVTTILGLILFSLPCFLYMVFGR